MKKIMITILCMFLFLLHAGIMKAEVSSRAVIRWLDVPSDPL